METYRVIIREKIYTTYKLENNFCCRETEDLMCYFTFTYFLLFNNVNHRTYVTLKLFLYIFGSDKIFVNDRLYLTKEGVFGTYSNCDTTIANFILCSDKILKMYTIYFMIQTVTLNYILSKTTVIYRRK